MDCGKDIATIDRHGRLKAGKGFTAPVTITVTAVSAENSAITATRTVQILPPVTTVAISAPRNYIDVDGEDKTLQLTARVLPEDAAQSVTWSTSNKRIATVDAEFGEMVEWSITTVLKTVVPRGTGGSNPSLPQEPSERNFRRLFSFSHFYNKKLIILSQSQKSAQNQLLKCERRFLQPNRTT